MARLIDADALQLETDPWGGMNGVLILGRSGGKTMALVQAALKRMIENAPTIDAVPVVRCKDCKHLYCCSAVDRMFYCRHPKGLKGMPNIVEENPFCPYGERREGDA